MTPRIRMLIVTALLAFGMAFIAGQWRGSPAATGANGVEAARGSLLSLASRETGYGSISLKDHELQSINTSVHDLCALRHQFILIDAFKVSITTKNHDVALAILAAAGGHLDFRAENTLLRDIVESAPEGYFHSEPEEIVSLVTQTIDRGAPVGAENGEAALETACISGFPRTMRLLSDAGASFARSGTSSDTQTQRLTVEQLLRATLDRLRTKSFRCDQWREEGFVALRDTYGPILLLLLDAVDVSRFGDSNLDWFFTLACFLGDLDLVTKLHDLGLRPKQCALLPDDRFRPASPAQAAVMGFKLEVLRFLLDNGADPREKAEFSPLHGEPENLTLIETALRWSGACAEKQFAICELLLGRGVSDEDAQACLRFAVQQNWLERVRGLIEHGVKPEVVPTTATQEMIELLIKHGASLNGTELLDHALHESDFPMVQYLQTQHGVRFDRQYFGSVAQNIMLTMGCGHCERRSDYMELLQHLLQQAEYTIDTPFVYHRKGKLETIDSVPTNASEPEGAFRTEKTFEDWPGTGERTSLLRLACKHEMEPAVRALLDAGADISCPGFEESALVYYAGRPNADEHYGGKQAHPRLLQTLLRYSSQSQVDDLRSRFAGRVEEHEKFVRFLVDDHENERSVTEVLALPPAEPQDLEIVHDATRDVLPPFRHTRLADTGTIRLFHLSPSLSHNEPITGSVTLHDISHAPDFEFLSWAPDGRSNLTRIKVDNAALEVSGELAVALQHLRNSNEERIFWIDAICLDLRADKEIPDQYLARKRAAQSAQRGVVWLGPAADDSGLIFEQFHKWDEWCARPESKGTWNMEACINPPGYRGATQTAFEALTRRAWFYRDLSLLEVIISKRQLAVCGTDARSLEEIVLASSFHMDGWDFHPLRGRDGPSQAHAILALGREGQSYLPSIMKSMSFCRADSLRQRISVIQTLLDQTLVDVESAASDAQLARDFTRAAISREGNLDVLSWLELDLHGADADNAASWVPDWQSPRRTSALPRVFSTHLYDEEFPHRGSEAFRFSNNDSLIVAGKSINDISLLGPDLPIDVDHVPGTNAFRHVLRAWERAVADSPSTTASRALHAFARSLQAGDKYHVFPEHDSDSDPTADPVLDHGYTLWNHHFGAGVVSRSFRDALVENELIMALLRDDYGPSRLEAALRHVRGVVERSLPGRRFFVAERGGRISMGLAPREARVGDEVVLLKGGMSPFVMRRMGEGDGDGGYRMVGSCFLEGIDLDGFSARERREVPWREFEIR